MENSKYTPSEIRKVIVTITASILTIFGVMMIYSDVKAYGKIKLQSNIFQGEIESGNAGILLIFFAVFLFLIALNNNSEKKINLEFTFSKFLILLFLFLGFIGIISFLLINPGYINNNKDALALLSFALLPSIVGLLFYIFGMGSKIINGKK
jgi:hypothetical protein